MLSEHKTKIVATIGPASESPEMLERLIRAGLNVARLNFSHGDFAEHGERIRRIRTAERVTGIDLMGALREGRDIIDLMFCTSDK